MHFVKDVIVLLLVVTLCACNYNRKESKKHHYSKHKGSKRANEQDDLVIEIGNGFVEGIKMSDKLYAYRGIPYAKPPLGELRFEPPQKPENWTGIWNATYDRAPCYQSGANLSTLVTPKGREDCLYINVYLPQKPRTDTLPVMAFSYGGYFLFGTSEYKKYSPDCLVQENVIVVTFNYRVGVFGFISTADMVAPGNAGLKDQVLALKWIQENIRYFGGDPKKVTIFGASAGAASVSYLTLSPLATGLFKAAIIESGTAIATWALSKKAREAAFLIGDSIGVLTDNSSLLIKHLKQISAYDLQLRAYAVMWQLFSQDPLNGLIYAPVLEPKHTDAIISECSFELLSSGNVNRVPIIIGFTSSEASGSAEYIELVSAALITYDLQPKRLVPLDMNANKSELTTIGQKIKEHYTHGNGSFARTSDDFVEFLSHDLFVRPVVKNAKLASVYNTVYLYQFSFTSNPNDSGAPHYSEIPYLFNYNLTQPDDIKTRDLMVKLWTNFAKYCDPTYTSVGLSGNTSWKPVTSGAVNYLNIDRDTKLDQDPFKEDMDFWEDLYTEYGHPPFCTY